MPQTIEDIQNRAELTLSSFNADARTIDVVLATESEVKRRSWEDGSYIEVLAINKTAIDTSRLDALPLLDQHDAYSGLASRLGSVLAGSLRVESGKAIVTAKISRNAGGEALFRDLEDGHVLGASVGYRIDTFEKTEAPSSGGLPTIRATRWTPLELSIVSIPADPAATTRALQTEEDHTMPQTEQLERQDERQPRNDTIRERTRQKELREIAKLAGIADAELVRAIDDGSTTDAFRARALEAMVQREEQSPTFPHSELRDSRTNYQEQVILREEAIAARMTGTVPQGNARHFMSASLMDHARGLLEAQGVDTRTLSREQILGYRGRSMGGMHTTSDFPLLLQGAGHRVLMQAYELAQSPLKTVLSRRSTANDFRAKSSLKISDGGLLTKVNESGEIKSMTRAETAESYKVETYGRIFALSFQAIVNDDLGAFTDWSVQAGRMAALTENKVLLDLLLDGEGAGPLMSEDNEHLFHEVHKNLAEVGTALDENNLGNGILAFRKQTSLGGQRTNLAPRYILTGPELELTAQKLVASISPATTHDAVPDAIKNLVPVVEPNLDGKSWYLFGDPAAAPVLEWSYLSGYEGPQIDSRDGFERLGTEFRAVLHFGGGAVDFRGTYRNPGVN
ncbi:prohead protease/major capsid protein fusion protein [Agrobacterium sp. Azo12]|uniref:prohead protease/major capsid protein fusion protein n=1 Tax=Agrobacterium sp. Azo12 TaxID=3031129 RepID=UPI0023D8AE97|nr:prohead protease/major capsid protein fusion protein [Agrobacterium sp. Azo12]MDO5896548.1 HK97 family phage prohead protease [Agrobacterium sp. Azo12]